MAVLPIINYGDPVLRARGEPVRAFDGELARFAREMVETMRAASGIGLAAPQVGRSLQLFVLDTSHNSEPLEFDGRPVTDPSALMPMALANAEVTILPGESETVDEGCLSFPGVRGHVDRVERVAVDFRDLTGAPHRLVATGLLARCIQHEHDHCQGVLFIDRMSPGHRMRAEPKIRRLLRETQASRRPG
jgi:peptide deformylase